jgi:hypothetical protein
LPPGLIDDDPTRGMVLPRLHHHPSILARSPNEGLYNNLQYDKDMGLMRKLMNLDEFQCPGNNNGSSNNNNDMNATKQQFHQYSNGIFNGGKFANATTPTFPFPYDKQLQQTPASTNGGIRHEGLLKPCYDFPTKADGLLDDGFGSGPISRKQQQQTSMFTSSGFMNQFPHESLFGANNHHSTNFTKLNEINNNNNNNGGGIVVKMENGIGVNDFNTLQMNNNKSNDILCPRSSSILNKTEPNEFRNSSCKIAADNMQRDDEDQQQKSSALHDDSNDGFTQL